MPSFMMSTSWSESLSLTSMSGYLSLKSGIPEAISRRPSPSGAVTLIVPRGWPESAAIAASASAMASSTCLAPV